MPANGSGTSLFAETLFCRCLRNAGGMRSMGRGEGIFCFDLAKSQRCIARTNSSQDNWPSESMSERSQIFARSAWGNWDWTNRPLAWTPDKKPHRVRSCVLKSWVYFNFEACGTDHSTGAWTAGGLSKKIKCKRN